MSSLSRARIAHKLRASVKNDFDPQPKLTSDFLELYLKEGCPGPSPREQAISAIRYIGDAVSKTGEKLRNLEPGFFAIIGSPNPTFAGNILFELFDMGQVSGIKNQTLSSPPTIMSASLTLKGWQAYEDERKGLWAGKYGFIALKFNDTALENLVREIIKPVVKGELGFDVVDMRDVARAGVIDNIMRAQIRDAAFILVDLTHDNSGAYWEAGYAEGLGKPVIYICEKSKFERVQTHFDTNHCTTVVWDSAELAQFQQQLIATLRRSLNLF